MTRLNRATLPNAYRGLIPTPVILLSLLIAALPLARADDLTGLPVDDPKDLLPSPPAAPQPASPTGNLFAPLPGWARGVTLGPLPDKLKPMGRSTTAAAASRPQPLAPPKDATVSTTTTTTTTTAGAKPASSDPAMVAVSPFLQWIKANPQAAAAAARQQAESYHAGPAPENGPGAANPSARNPQDDAYWLPPLIDSADFGPSAVGGSAAIYSRPQR